MATYEVKNTRTGEILGSYEAENDLAALDAMARDAGHADYAAACAVNGDAAPFGPLAVREVHS